MEKIQCDKMWYRTHDDPGNKYVIARCSLKAKFFIMARGGKYWDGYYCGKHVVSILKRRMSLIKKYKQNVTVRPITEYDKKRIKDKREGK